MQTVDMRAFSYRIRLFKNIDPKVYEQTVQLLNEYVMELTVAVTVAPPDQILVAQGRAQQAMKFFQFFTELPSDDPAKQPVQPSPGP